MDTHGRTWTNTFSHGRLGMTKTPRRQLLVCGIWRPCQDCQIVYVGPCGSMAKKVFDVGCIICLYFHQVILSQKLELLCLFETATDVVLERMFGTGAFPVCPPFLPLARKGCFLKGFTTRKPTSAAVKPLRLAISVFEKNLKSAQRLGKP